MKTIRFGKMTVVIHLVLIAILGCGQTTMVKPQPLTALEAKALIEKNADNPNFRILDVRTPKEFARGHLAGAFMLDYHSPGFLKGIQALDRSKNYLIYCRTGNRSSRTLKLIANMGFESIFHMKNGIVDWQAQKLPVVKQL